MVIHIQKKARRDLKNIYTEGVKTWGEMQADKYYDELTTALNTLSANPKLGKSCDFIRSGYRRYHVNKHVIFYRLTSNKIHIVRILRGEMDFMRHF